VKPDTVGAKAPMNNVYLNWILLIGGGVIVGLFASPRAVLIFVAVAFGIAALGLVLGAMQNNESLAVLSGLALMMIPVGGGLLVLGAGLTGEARRIMANRKKRLKTEEASRKV
jgi:uncharacterized membrane protein YidH (DUF202 family)